MALTYTVGVSSPTNLWQLVQDYTSNTESSFVTNIPTFVQVAEERIYNTVQIPALRKSQTGSMTANNSYLVVPTDWLANFALSVTDLTGNVTFLLNKDVEFIREAFPVSSATGLPTHYSVFSTTSFLLGPTPDQNYGAEIHYYYYPASIVTATTSWLGTNFENVLLYGTLREAYLYMKGEQDLVQYYDAKYQEGIELLRGYGEGKSRRDAYRSGQIRTSPP